MYVSINKFFMKFVCFWLMLVSERTLKRSLKSMDFSNELGIMQYWSSKTNWQFSLRAASDLSTSPVATASTRYWLALSFSYNSPFFKQCFYIRVMSTKASNEFWSSATILQSLICKFFFLYSKDTTFKSIW